MTIHRLHSVFISFLFLLATAVSLAACGGAAAPATDAVAGSAAAAPTATTAAPAGNAQGQSASPTSPAGAAKTGASGGQGSGIDLGKLNACTLLNQADIEAVMGPVNYTPQLSVAPADAFLFRDRECTFVNDVVLMNQDNTGQHQVDLWVWTPDSWQDLQSSFGPGQPVSGIGDEAFSADFNLGAGVWVLLKNRAVVNMNVYPRNPDLAMQLARKVIARLP